MSKQEKNNQTKNSFLSVIKSLSKSFDKIHNEINSHPYISNTLNVIRFRQFDIEKKLCDLENRVSGLEIINTNNQNDIFLLSERLSALEQGDKSAQQTDKEEQVKLPKDLLSFFKDFASVDFDCRSIRCCDCVFYHGMCLLRRVRDLSYKYGIEVE